MADWQPLGERISTEILEGTNTWGAPLRKVISVPLTKSRRDKDGSLLVRGFFTSDNRDEAGDIVTRAATERATDKYRRWGNIRYMHQPIPIGKVVKMGLSDSLEWNEIEIRVLKREYIEDVENGLLQALSIGALVYLDDVEIMEDGGWIIHAYDLAEISLVDHPANYDAMLKGINVTDEFRMLVRSYGITSVMRSLGDVARMATRAHPETEEKTMDETILVPAEEQEQPEVAEVVAEQVEAVEVELALEPEAVVEPAILPVDETAQVEEVEPEAEVVEVEASLEPEVEEVVEPEPVADETVEVEMALDAGDEPTEPEVEAVVIEASLEVEPEVEAEPAQEDAIEMEAVVEPVVEAALHEASLEVETFEAAELGTTDAEPIVEHVTVEMFRELQATVKALTARLEGQAEVPEAEEQSETETETVDEVEALKARIATLEADLEAANKVSDRTAYVQADELPGEPDGAEDVVEEPKALTLKDALRRRFQVG